MVLELKKDGSIDFDRFLERIDLIEKELIKLHEENEYLKEVLRLMYERNYEICKQRKQRN